MGNIINNFKDSRVWRIARWPLLVIAVLYVGGVIYRIPVVLERRNEEVLNRKTPEVVKKIREQRLTLADVDGKHLPPAPDPALKDATLEGIDANSNGIRDDVELAIFKSHPDSARIRAAELQYAMALQVEFTKDVFNSETFVETLHRESKGSSCILDVLRAAKDYNLVIKRKEEVKNLVLNTTARTQRREDVFEKYMTTNSLPEESCDIDLTSLPN